MRRIIIVIAILFSALSFSQSINELKGEWNLVEVSFSGPEAEDMSDEDKTVPCLEKSFFVFAEKEITSNLFSGDDCDLLEKEKATYRLTKDLNIEVWDEFLNRWDLAEIKNFTSNSFQLVYSDEELSFTISLSKK